MQVTDRKLQCNIKLCMLLFLFQILKEMIQYKKQSFTWVALVDEVLKAFAILTG